MLCNRFRKARVWATEGSHLWLADHFRICCILLLYNLFQCIILKVQLNIDRFAKERACEEKSMTRLKSEWVENIYKKLDAAQNSLFAKTGMDYAALAAMVRGITRDELTKAAKNARAAAIPITQGQGVISRFSETVAAILCVSGFDAFVTEANDVSGIHEAHRLGANILFIADDRRFIALNTEKTILADNDDATVLGFIAALNAMAGGLFGKDILVMGCGKLGKLALAHLKQRGARPTVFDKDHEALDYAVAEGFAVIRHIEGIAGFRLLFDTTNTGSWLTTGMIHPEALIAAPGVPLSLDEGAAAAHSERLVHDLLPIGVAAMFGLAY